MQVNGVFLIQKLGNIETTSLLFHKVETQNFASLLVAENVIKPHFSNDFKERRSKPVHLQRFWWAFILFQLITLHFLPLLIVAHQMKRKDPHSIVMRKQYATHP